MPADLRIAQFLTKPRPPEAMAPFFFQVECANVGDEGTGPFVVRFELDQAESVEVPVENVAPQESEWVNWPYDAGLIAGDHHVHCLLDAARAVPEPEVGGNQKSLYFKVADIEFGPADARRGEEDYNEEALAAAVIDTIKHRVNHWTDLAVGAIVAWESEAKTRVADYSDAKATVDPVPVIAAFGEAVVRHLPGMSTALGIMKDASQLLGLVQSYMGTEPMGLVGARARLLAAIDNIKVATSKAIGEAFDGYEGPLNSWLSTENPNSPLHQIQFASTRPEYVASVAESLGFPEPTLENTTEPIKQEMMEGFERVMEAVNRQLFREN
jgi:hypothetical protein